jgi:hypothetical protein
VDFVPITEETEGGADRISIVLQNGSESGNDCGIIIDRGNRCI